MRDWGRAARGSLSAKNQEEKPKYKCRINVSESVHLREKRGKKPTPETKRNIKERDADENIFFCYSISSARARNARKKDKGIYFHENPEKFAGIFVEKTAEKHGTFARKGLSHGDGCDKVNGTGGIDTESKMLCWSDKLHRMFFLLTFFGTVHIAGRRVKPVHRESPPDISRRWFI